MNFTKKNLYHYSYRNIIKKMMVLMLSTIDYRYDCHRVNHHNCAPYSFTKNRQFCQRKSNE